MRQGYYSIQFNCQDYALGLLITISSYRNAPPGDPILITKAPIWA